MRRDILNIVNFVEKGSSVLDLGCGDGELLSLLITKKNCKGKGIEINEKKILKCIEKGLTVYHGDMDEILSCYQNRSYDYIILSLTLHQVKNPEKIIDESVRIGKKVIISFPNFANWRIRFNLLFKGTLPTYDSCAYEWYSENYVHFITIKEFERFCKKKGLKILKKKFLPETFFWINPNFIAHSAIYCLESYLF